MYFADLNPLIKSPGCFPHKPVPAPGAGDAVHQAVCLAGAPEGEELHLLRMGNTPTHHYLPGESAVIKCPDIVFYT